jgi:hypothetical protein
METIKPDYLCGVRLFLSGKAIGSQQAPGAYNKKGLQSEGLFHKDL